MVSDYTVDDRRFFLLFGPSSVIRTASRTPLLKSSRTERIPLLMTEGTSGTGSVENGYLGGIEKSPIALRIAEESVLATRMLPYPAPSNARLRGSKQSRCTQFGTHLEVLRRGLDGIGMTISPSALRVRHRRPTSLVRPLRLCPVARLRTVALPDTHSE